MSELTHIDLFSGIGGFALAAKWAGFETKVFCEIDPFCQKVLKKHWPNVPIVEDIKKFDGKEWTGATLLTGGFPCQPFSVAGKRRGKEDDRYLWPEMLRIISEARPAWVLGENVAGIIRMDFDQMLSDLEGIKYETQAVIIPACGVGATHRRERIWIMAHSDKFMLEGGRNVKESNKEDGRQVLSVGEGCRNYGWWDIEPNMGRMADGIPNRVDRLRALGNAIVPQVAYQIIKAIREIEQ